MLLVGVQVCLPFPHCYLHPLTSSCAGQAELRSDTTTLQALQANGQTPISTSDVRIFPITLTVSDREPCPGAEAGKLTKV